MTTYDGQDRRMTPDEGVTTQLFNAISDFRREINGRLDGIAAEISDYRKEAVTHSELDLAFKASEEDRKRLGARCSDLEHRADFKAEREDVNNVVARLNAVEKTTNWQTGGLILIAASIPIALWIADKLMHL